MTTTPDAPIVDDSSAGTGEADDDANFFQLSLTDLTTRQNTLAPPTPTADPPLLPLDQLDPSVLERVVAELVSVGNRAGSMFARRATLTDEHRRRTRIASQWYRRGQAEADPTNAYIAFWLVLEALELDQNANITPLRRAVVDLLGVEPPAIAERLGRLNGTRSRLVHGQLHAVADVDLTAVAALAQALLERHLTGSTSLARVEVLRSIVCPGD